MSNLILGDIDISPLLNAKKYWMKELNLQTLIRVDLVFWNNMSEGFQKLIEKDLTPL